MSYDLTLEQYKTIVSNAQDIITIFSPLGEILFESPSVTAALGYQMEDIVGTNVTQYIDPRDLGGVLKAIQFGLLHPGMGQKTTFRFRHKDGTYRYLESIGIFLAHWGTTGAIIVSSRDVTLEKNDQETLLLQTKALEAAANGMLITDATGSIIWVNESILKLTGYSREELIGQNPRIFKSGVQGQEVYENLWKTVLAGNIWQSQIINKKKDGSFYTEEMTITPIKSDGKNITHFIAIKQDITERISSEKQREKYAQELESMNKLMIGRELKMVELKKEIEQLTANKP